MHTFARIAHFTNKEKVEAIMVGTSTVDDGIHDILSALLLDVEIWRLGTCYYLLLSISWKHENTIL